MHRASVPPAELYFHITSSSSCANTKASRLIMAAAIYNSFSTYPKERNDEFRFNATTGPLCGEPATLFSLASNGDYCFRVAESPCGPESRRCARYRRAFEKYLCDYRRGAADDRRREHHRLDQAVRRDACARV